MVEQRWGGVENDDIDPIGTESGDERRGEVRRMTSCWISA
jgi:hypothetical protein